MSHEHVWRKTGQFFATIPPTYIYACDECRSIGQAPEGEPVSKVARVDDDEAWAHYYALAARETGTAGEPDWQTKHRHLLSGIRIMAAHLDPEDVERIGREAEVRARMDAKGERVRRPDAEKGEPNA